MGGHPGGGTALLGLLILAALYLVICVARWRVARHYGQRLRPLSPMDLLEAWDHLRYDHRHRVAKVIVVTWTCVGLYLMTRGLMTLFGV
jgi:hypothetical protein